MTVGIGAIVLIAGSAFAGDISQVNGFKAEMRIFNDFPLTSLSVGPVGGPYIPAPVPTSIPVPGNSLQINEDFGPGAIGNFANKHVGFFSTDGGASRYRANASQSFSLDFDITINAPAGAPRKEAGVFIRNPRTNNNPFYVDEGEVMVASDGEVALFGAAMPFFSFHNVYTLGSTDHVSFRFFAPGTVHPTLGAYQMVITDPVTGINDSASPINQALAQSEVGGTAQFTPGGLRLWDVQGDGLEGFNNDAEFGFLMQAQRNPLISDSYSVLYNGLHVVPAPGAMALLGLAGLAAGRRRR